MIGGQSQIYRASIVKNLVLSMPVTLITFKRLFWPLIITTELFATSRRLAIKEIQAALAAPSTGGEVNLILRQSPIIPATAFLLDRGWTRTLKAMPSGKSLISIGMSDKSSFHPRQHC